CFTCKDFKDFIEKHKSDDIYVIGYNTPMCILSTMVYAKNERYKLILVEDACWAKSYGNLSERQVHENVIGIIGGHGYASLIKFADLKVKMNLIS
ncbi:MAG: isochorismatase family protein, partial [Gammaproteobacteria bacterium]